MLPSSLRHSDLWCWMHLRRSARVDRSTGWYRDEPDSNNGLQPDLSRARGAQRGQQYAAGCAEFLELAAEVPVRTEVQTFALEQANQALLALKQSRIDGAGVLQIA